MKLAVEFMFFFLSLSKRVKNQCLILVCVLNSRISSNGLFYRMDISLCQSSSRAFVWVRISSLILRELLNFVVPPGFFFGLK